MRPRSVNTGGALAIFLAALIFGGPGAAPARAAVMEAQASLSPTQAMTGETIQLVVRVTADKKEELPWPRVEGLAPFTVNKSTQVSSGSQTSIVNGTITRSEYHITEFVYNLTTQRPGEYTVGPIRYAHKDFQRDLGSAVVGVTKGEAGIATRPMLGKARVYVGEQTLYTLRIIPKEGVQSVNWPNDMQKYIGQKFYFQPVDSAIAPKVATVDGRETQVLDLRIALFPLLAGTAVLEGIPVEYRQVKRTPRTGSPADMFEEFFNGGGGRVITQTLQAPSLRLEAAPLPGNAPQDFSGSVGKYTLSARLDRNEAATGDAVSLTVVIRGNGQPKSVLQPSLPELSRFEVYDPEKTSVSQVENGTLWTTHTFKYALIPNREGDYDFSGISFAYFDPARGAYARAKPADSDLKLRVKRGQGGAYAPSRDIAESGDDIRSLKTGGPALRDDSRLPYRHPGFGFLFLLPPLVFAGALWARRRRDRLHADTALLRRSQANRKLRARLKGARAALDAGDARGFYHALSEAMAAFASDRLNREFRGLTLAEARAALAERGASPATVESYDALLQRCDFMLFAGASASSQETRRDLESGETLLAALDKELA